MGHVKPDESDEILQHELFNIDKMSVKYSRTKHGRRVLAVIEDPEKEISEMKLYLFLDSECRKLERRLGISDATDGECQ